MELTRSYPSLVLLVFSFFSSILQCNCAERNNVCSSLTAYFFMQHSSKCWHDFAASDKTPRIIIKSGYPFREYKVVTEDDYILTVFRIPSSKNAEKGAVFLQHGLESSGTLFTSLGNQSLAFLLADSGYDVWIGNFRGNEYSEGHKYLDVSMQKYWDYSLDDIALKDIPAMINLVKLNTPSRDKVVYVGHSWGTTLAMMYCSEYQQQCKENIKHFFWLGPAYKLTYMKSPYRVIFPYGKVLIQTVPILINQLPAGTSLKASLDYFKYATKGEFRKYDYGPTKNMAVYGTRKAPDYDITTINVNVSLFYSTSDWATGDKDAEVLYNVLPENVRYGNHKIDRPNFNHFDYIMGPSAKELIYDVILEELNSIG